MTQPVPPQSGGSEMLPKNEENAIVTIPEPDREPVKVPQGQEEQITRPEAQLDSDSARKAKPEKASTAQSTVQTRQEQIAIKSSQHSKKQSGAKAKAIASAIAITMLPVLAVGTVTYWVGNRVITQQINEARRAGATRLAETELSQQRQLLENLLLGTGVAALIAGAIAAISTRRAIRSTTLTTVTNDGREGERDKVEQAQQLAELICHLHDTRHEDAILEVATAGVRNLLNCDRVLFYSREDTTRGKILAESVVPNFPKAMGQVIDDPCFQTWYDEKYQQGRVHAIDNIYEAGLSECYIEQLAKLSVQATLTAPIVSEGKLLSLFIAHQCSQKRAWQPSEIDLLTQITKQISIALDNAKFLRERENSQQRADREAQWMQFYSEFSQDSDRSLKEKDVLKATVEEVRKIFGCDRVLFYSREDTTQGRILAESVIPGLPRAIGQVIKDPCFEAWYNEKYQQGRVQAIDNIYEADLTPCYIEQLSKLSIQATLTAPVLGQGKLISLLIAHQCSGSRAWQTSEIDLFTQITKQVGILLDRARFAADYERLQIQIQEEDRRTQLFTQATQHIRASLEEKDILEAAVEEIRRNLECDRVVVYSQEKNKRGVVIAESVAPGYPRAMGQIIKDPCFEVNYVEKYQNGRVQALDNIYEAGMTPCYIEQLERLTVKANLVAPILNEGKLLGLLIAHQCAAPRTWQQTEIRWFAQIAMQVGFAIDNARLIANYASLAQQNNIDARWTQFFTETTQHIRASLQEKDVLEAATREVRRFLDCDRVVVYSREEGSRGVIIAESVAPGWIKTLGRTIEDPCFEARYDEQYRNGRVRAFENIHTSGLTSCYVEQLENIAVKANLVAPILNEGKLLGLLVAHQCAVPRIWQQMEIRWFAQIAMQVGFAIDNARVMANYATLQQQSDGESRWTQLFTETVQSIRASLKEKDVLETSVEAVRKVLSCDRVVVYSREEGSRGVIIAESVAPGWVKTLGRTIEDPCFEARYDEQYRNGRVRAFENIHTSGLTSCYVEQLENMAVKANLVAPILNEGKLLGLLVAHQCAVPRTWQQMEIRWFAQIAMQVGFTIEQARILEQVKQAHQQTATIAREQYQQKDLLQRLVTELLKDSQIALASLAQDSQSQQEAIARAIEQIQGMADSAWIMVASTQQAELQLQKIDQTVRVGQETANHIDRSLTSIGTLVSDSATQVKQLGQFSQKVSQVIHLVNELVGQINQQSMNVTIAAGRSRSSGQESVVVLAETVRSLAQQLAEVTTEINPLIVEIETQADNLAALMKSSTQQAITQTTQLLEETRQKLDRIGTLDTQLSAQVRELSLAATKGAQTLTSANQSIPEVASLASHTSGQTIAAAESFFTKLEMFAKELQAIAE